MADRLLFDTNIYVSVLRDKAFAARFRPRYLRDVPRTHMSSVVVQELLAGARTPRHRQQVAALYEPMERVGRIITPSHLAWKEAGTLVAKVASTVPQFATRLTPGFLNDVLIALCGRSCGATIVTRNAADFQMIRQFRSFELEIL